MSRHKRAPSSDGGHAASPRTTQLVNERAHILGLQLQQAALAIRIDDAIRSYGLPTPQQQLHELLHAGILHEDLAAAREEVAALKTLLDRVQSGRLASTSTSNPTSQASLRPSGPRPPGGASNPSSSATSRASSSKQFHALASDHVKLWLEQAQEAALLLEDLVTPGVIDEYPLDPPDEPPLPRPPGGTPIAHFIHRIPPELTSLMTLPDIGYGRRRSATTAPTSLQPPQAQHQQVPMQNGPSGLGPLSRGAGLLGQSAQPVLRSQHHSQQDMEAPSANGSIPACSSAACKCGSPSRGCGCDCGAGSAGGSVLWDAAPLLHDPATGVSYRVACHESAELMWPSLSHGDLVLLLPGRYNWPEGTVLLRAAVRVLGLGRQSSDVVIHNDEDDDVFVECAAGPPPPPPPPPLGPAAAAAAAATAALLATAMGGAAASCPRAAGIGGRVAGDRAGIGGSQGGSAAESAGVVLENLTLLQLGGYEGALRVLKGRTTLVDVVVQFAMGGVQVDPGAHLVMRNCRVVGGATAGVQVAAGGVLELLGGCEVSRCGGGDDVVPKDLGGVEVMVSLADHPRLALPTPRAVLQAHADILAAVNSTAVIPGVAAANTRPPGARSPTAPSSAASGAPAPAGPPASSALDRLMPYLGSLQLPAVVVVGPGCSVQNSRGFAISLVKKRSLAAYHDLLHSSSSHHHHHSHAATSGGGGGGGGAGGTGGGGGGGGCSLAAALEGARVLVARGSLLGPNNSRGALGVVEAEYHQLDGDSVNRRTASRHFHAVQLAARQLQEGFASPGVDWTSHRIRLESNPARPGRRATKIEVAAAAAASVASAAVASSGSGSRRGSTAPSGIVVGSRTLRQILCASMARAQRRQRGLGSGVTSGNRKRGGSSSSGMSDSSSSSSEGEGNSGSSSRFDGGRTDGSSDDSGMETDDVYGNGCEGKDTVQVRLEGGGGLGAVSRLLQQQQDERHGLRPVRECALCRWSPCAPQRNSTPQGDVGSLPVGRSLAAQGRDCAQQHPVVGSEALEGSSCVARDGGTAVGLSSNRDGMAVAFPHAESASGMRVALSEDAPAGGCHTAPDAQSSTSAITSGGALLSHPALFSSPLTAAAVAQHMPRSTGAPEPNACAPTCLSSRAATGSPLLPAGASPASLASLASSSAAAAAAAAAAGIDAAGSSQLAPLSGVDIDRASEGATPCSKTAGMGATATVSVPTAAVSSKQGDGSSGANNSSGGASKGATTGFGGSEEGSLPAAGAPDGFLAAGALKLRRCGGCLRVWYCSNECQRQDWPRHAPECRGARARAVAVGGAAASQLPGAQEAAGAGGAAVVGPSISSPGGVT